MHGNVCRKAGGVGNISGDTVGGVGCAGLSFCSSENNSPNKVFTLVRMSQEKSGEKRKSPSWGNGDAAIQNADNGGRTIIAIPTGKKMKIVNMSKNIRPADCHFKKAVGFLMKYQDMALLNDSNCNGNGNCDSML